MMRPLVLVMLPNRALTREAFSLSSYFSAFFVCVDLLVYQDRHNSRNITIVRDHHNGVGSSGVRTVPDRDAEDGDVEGRPLKLGGFSHGMGVAGSILQGSTTNPGIGRT
jgi:hypothetical protein